MRRFDEIDHILGRSFRGATEGGEPGIHSPQPVVMDSGLAACAAPRNDAGCDANFEIAVLAMKPGHTRSRARQGVDFRIF